MIFTHQEEVMMNILTGRINKRPRRDRWVSIDWLEMQCGGSRDTLHDLIRRNAFLRKGKLYSVPS